MEHLFNIYNTPSNYNPLNEMAQVNIKEMRIFPFNAYRIFVLPEGPNKFKHFHIKSLQDGWEIRVLLNGHIHSVKTKSSKRTKIEDFADIQKMIHKWLLEKCATLKVITNKQNIENAWVMENEGRW